jgi:pyrophosphatase PpaX
MNQYDYVLFDWDGTIAKTLDVWMESLKVALVKRGYSFTDRQIGADYELFKSRFSELGDKTLGAVIEEALMLSNKSIPTVKMYEDNVRVLNLLRKNNKQLGVVTTSEHATISQLLKQHDMASLFDVVIGGDDVANQKPHAEPIIKALDALSATKSRTVMVGDSDKDILSAQNAGIDSVLFYPPEHANYHDIKYLMSLRPTYVVGSYQEIGDLLAQCP